MNDEKKTKALDCLIERVAAGKATKEEVEHLRKLERRAAEARLQWGIAHLDSIEGLIQAVSAYDTGHPTAFRYDDRLVDALMRLDEQSLQAVISATDRTGLLMTKLARRIQDGRLVLKCALKNINNSKPHERYGAMMTLMDAIEKMPTEILLCNSVLAAELVKTIRKNKENADRVARFALKNAMLQEK